ncbi:MAG: type II toxin-antitoxin system Phd/YefM family antitoxin [Steroidobacteraceae bacterium]
MKTTIGAYEAKTRLPELLREVQAGRRFSITNRGRVVAELVPSGAGELQMAGDAIDRFAAFLKANPVRKRVDIKALIESGRE